MNATAEKSRVTPAREFVHPLRALPWFRKLPDKLWVAALLTALFCVFTGILFALIAPVPTSFSQFGRRLVDSFIYSFAIGYSIHFLSQILGRRIRQYLCDYPFPVRLFANVCVWMLGLVLGFAIANLITGYTVQEGNYAFPVAACLTILASVITGLAMRHYALRDLAAEREKAERSEVQRTLATARLRLLQAQIEPHFLFNTLANVSSLIEVDPKQARKMLDELTLLLRASLDSTRRATTSLRKELQVVEAYLGVLKVRMGERLSFGVQAPQEFMDLEVPSMLIQPIVENAVKHGIEPRVRGGTVTITARREGEQLVFVVEDDGVGFVGEAKENVGLGVVRERLAVQFGTDAALKLERTVDQMTRVTIRIPFPESPV